MKQYGRIINSIFDNDLYKFTQQQAVTQMFPKTQVRYSFILRSKVTFPIGFDVELRRQLSLMADLRVTPTEKEYLQDTCSSYMKPTYIDFLSGYCYDQSEVGIIQKGGDLEISIGGYWYKTILWEVTLMALISELYFKMTGQEPWDKNTRLKNNAEKHQKLNISGAKTADFGTRRRFSYEVHDELVGSMNAYAASNFFQGTSNVHLAMKHGVKPIGTMAHEWVMVMACIYGYRMANEMAMKHWVDVYKGNLGIILTDTFTTEEFLHNFTMKYAKLYDGPRHDSKDPYVWGENFIKHYRKLNINPLSKTGVYSDGLNTDKAIAINEYFKGKFGSSFGIGTHFTNDVGVTPLNMVIKVTQAFVNERWYDCVKLSDDPIKHTGNPEEIKLCKDTLKISVVESK